MSQKVEIEIYPITVNFIGLISLNKEKNARKEKNN